MMTFYKRIIALSLLMAGLFVQLGAQVRVSGIIRDTTSGELLVGAHIIEQGTQHATVSDNNGYFSLVLTLKSKIEIVYVGFNRLVIPINSAKDTILNIRMVSDNQLEEVIVKAPGTSFSNVSGLSGREIMYLPAIGSRPDVMKTIQLLPGIQSQNEGSSLLLVRGGDPGQNLYLIDNVPLIYVNHLGGYMSVFNPEMINTVNVYKDGFPAHYGGKLSSIVDITQREGNSSDLCGTFSLGITDMSFSIEGPIAKKSTFLVTGRTSFLGLFSSMATWLLPDNAYVMYYGFHDVNAKYSWKPNIKNSFHVNFYQGDDYLRFKVKDEYLLKGEKSLTSSMWGNWLLSARWNSIVSGRLHASNSLSFTRYQLNNKQEGLAQSDMGLTDFTNNFLSSLSDLSFNSNWKYEVARPYSVEFGLQSTWLINMPNKTEITNQPVQIYENKNSVLNSVFIENKLRFLNYSFANLGVRATHYVTDNFMDFNPEPRIHVSFGLNTRHSINLSYMRTWQYSHMLFTPGSINSNEVWIPADNTVSPSWADQYNAGWKGSFHNEMFGAEMNVYTKQMGNLASYKNGFSGIAGDPDYYSKIETGGKGFSQGFEVFLRKNYGNFTGFLSYSYTHTTRQYPEINEGREYRFEFDRPHSLSTGITQKLGDKWRMNVVWIYQSGMPYTPAIGRQYTAASGYDAYYHAPVYEALIYGERNSARMKPYHRLDLSFNYQTQTKHGNKAEWTFSIYNVYNKQNAYYYYYNTTNTGEMLPPDYFEDYKPLSLYQVAFMPVIPSVSYKVFFDGNRKNYKKLHPEEGNKFKKWLYYEN